MSRIIPTIRWSKSLFIAISMLLVMGLMVVPSLAMKGMPGPSSQPQRQPAPSGPGIDWGKVFGPLLTPQPGPMIYPGEPTPEPPESIDLLWPSDSKPGLEMPREIPRLPEQQEPTPTTRPGTTNILDSTGGMTPQVLGAPVTPKLPETKSEQTPEDLLNNSPGNTQTPPGNQFAGPPEWKTPPGPGVKFLPPHGPADQDTIDSGKELRANDQKDKDKELGKQLEAAENEIVDQAEKDEAARQAAKELIDKAGELQKKAQEAVTELQKKAEDLQKKAQEAIDQMKKDAATDVGINEIDKFAKEADKANQAQQAKADAEQKAKDQAERQRKWKEENAKAWQEHQAKEQKAQQEAQAQGQLKQQQQAQQAQQAQQQQQQNEALKKQEQKELEDIGGAGKKYIK